MSVSVLTLALTANKEFGSIINEFKHFSFFFLSFFQSKYFSFAIIKLRRAAQSLTFRIELTRGFIHVYSWEIVALQLILINLDKELPHNMFLLYLYLNLNKTQ